MVHSTDTLAHEGERGGGRGKSVDEIESEIYSKRGRDRQRVRDRGRDKERQRDKQREREMQRGEERDAEGEEAKIC